MLLYCLLLTDLTVFSMRISAFLLVIGRVASKMGLFWGALAYVVVSSASAICSLNQKLKNFAGTHKGSQSLWKIAVRMFPTTQFEEIIDQPFDQKRESSSQGRLPHNRGGRQ